MSGFFNEYALLRCARCGFSAVHANVAGNDVVYCPNDACPQFKVKYLYDKPPVELQELKA